MLRILIVDDSSSARHLVCRHLSAHGSCEQAEDGLRAVEMVEKALDEADPYDLVVMDVEMPRLNGIEAVKRISALQDRRGLTEEERARVVMLSNHGDAELVLKAQYEAGAHLYVTKPFKPETLAQALASLDLLANPLDGA